MDSMNFGTSNFGITGSRDGGLERQMPRVTHSHVFRGRTQVSDPKCRDSIRLPNQNVAIPLALKSG